MYTYIHGCAQSLSRVWLFATPWIVARQAPLPVGFSRQGYWGGLLFSSPKDLPDLGTEPRSPALQAHTHIYNHLSHLFILFQILSSYRLLQNSQCFVLCSRALLIFWLWIACVYVNPTLLFYPSTPVPLSNCKFSFFVSGFISALYVRSFASFLIFRFNIRVISCDISLSLTSLSIILFGSLLLLPMASFYPLYGWEVLRCVHAPGRAPLCTRTTSPVLVHLLMDT